jgi:hypothetical protein
MVSLREDTQRGILLETQTKTKENELHWEQEIAPIQMSADTHHSTETKCSCVLFI